jgi:hypothetical protein
MGVSDGVAGDCPNGSFSSSGTGPDWIREKNKLLGGILSSPLECCGLYVESQGVVENKCEWRCSTRTQTSTNTRAATRVRSSPVGCAHYIQSHYSASIDESLLCLASELIIITKTTVCHINSVIHLPERSDPPTTMLSRTTARMSSRTNTRGLPIVHHWQFIIPNTDRVSTTITDHPYLPVCHISISLSSAPSALQGPFSRSGDNSTIQETIQLLGRLQHLALHD